jgi:deazaflavin-dependent oxidoreductase (nitroreductase family)
VDEVSQSSRVTVAAMMEVVEEMRTTGTGKKAIAFNDALVAEYRASGGTRIGELPIESTVLITMKGAKTGIERTIPLGVERIEGRLLIVGSSAGQPHHPQWFHNLVANPIVTVELMGDTFRAEAVIIEGGQRDALFALVSPMFHAHQARTTRILPVIELRPLADG